MLDKHGVLRPRAEVSAEEGRADSAVFRGSWDGGGTLELGNGRIYKWDNTHWRHTDWHWTDGTGQSLLRFKGSHMTIEPAGTRLPIISLLAMLSWYLNIMNNQVDDGSTAAVIAAVAATSRRVRSLDEN